MVSKSRTTLCHTVAVLDIRGRGCQVVVVVVVDRVLRLVGTTAKACADKMVSSFSYVPFGEGGGIGEGVG